MLARTLHNAVRTGARSMSTIPVGQVSSVLKFNVGNEDVAVKMDASVKTLSTMMKGHPGYQSCTRHVCKSEWAYEVAFLFADIDSFKAWKECKLRDDVHSTYLEAIADAGLKEEDIYGGARVHDVFP